MQKENCKIMKTHDFYFDLPEELIAQTPAEPRDSSRLMVLDKNTGAIEHRIFRDIADYLEAGDCLVLNDSRVIPARIFGTKDVTGAKVEFLLLRDLGDRTWEVLARPAKRAREGSRFSFGNMTGEVTGEFPEGIRHVRFDFSGNFYSVLEQIGQMPLPPYIKTELKDRERYQTVYSRELGSAAAPTAGLHFTDELLGRLAEKGVRIAFVTLHVGLGTFRPVKEEEIGEHKMHSEHYHMPKETAELLRVTRDEGKRIVAVGTTSCRTLESVMRKEGEFRESEGYTDIFIYPGYTFLGLDALITNFHLPESTLIMLVSALAGRENILHAYEVAVKEKYRFFSFGDAMLIK